MAAVPFVGCSVRRRMAKIKNLAVLFPYGDFLEMLDSAVI